MDMIEFKKNLIRSDSLKKIISIRSRRKIVNVLFSIFRLAFLVCISYIVLYPLLYMVVSSISTSESFSNSGRVWIPSEITFANFEFAATVLEYGKTVWATIKYELLSAIIEVCSCAVVAYGFARFKFPFRNLLMVLMFVTILIPTTMLIIPISVNFSHTDFLGILGLINKISGVDLRINLLNTPWAFWLPSLFASGLRSGIMIYIYIQFFKELPKELEEAAEVDGAGPFRTFIKIIIPSSSVVILTVVVFSVIWHWNDYQLALMYAPNEWTLGLALSNMKNTMTTTAFSVWGGAEQISYLMSGCLMFVLPPLVLYMIVQHWFIESVDRVGITG